MKTGLRNIQIMLPTELNNTQLMKQENFNMAVQKPVKILKEPNVKERNVAVVPVNVEDVKNAVVDRTYTILSLLPFNI